MMISAVSSTQQSQPVAQSPPPSSRKPVQPKPQSVITDAVQLSPAAQAAVSALQEARETPAQTTREAANGDNQARRLLAKEAAAKPQAK